VAPKAPARPAAAAGGARAAKEPTGTAKPRTKAAAPPSSDGAPAKPPAITKGAIKGATKASLKAPVQQMALPLDEGPGSVTKTPKTVAKTVTKPVSAKSADGGGSASPKPAPEGKATSAAGKAALRPTAAKPRVAATAPPSVDEKVEPKRAGQDDILIRFRGGKVGWMQRDK
jgi:hypothetical protein